MKKLVYTITHEDKIERNIISKIVFEGGHGSFYFNSALPEDCFSSKEEAQQELKARLQKKKDELEKKLNNL